MMKMPKNLSFRNFSIVLFLILILTGWNIIQNTGSVLVDEDPLERYGVAGMSFELEEGLKFNVSKLGDFALSYMRGYFYRVGFDERESPFMAFSWSDTKPSNFEQCLKRSYNITEEIDLEIGFEEVYTHNISDHVLTYVKIKIEHEQPRNAYLGYWECNNSERFFTVLVEAPVSYNSSKLFDLFNQTVSSAVCHFPGQRPRSETDIKLPVDEKTLINVSVMIIFCVGFTFTFMMEGFPNFAHTSYAVIGSMASFYLTRFFNINPYDTWGFAALFGGFLGIILYLLIVRPIKCHGGYQDITLTLSFLVIALVIPSVASIFNYWARYYGQVPTRGYNLGFYDFNYRGIAGISIIAPATCVLLVIGLHYFLGESKIGISLRATAEDEKLAATLGINTFRAHMVSWFISGALAALAGSIMTIRGGMGLGGPDDMIISIMSGSILGGTSNIYGAIIGGLFVALGQDILRNIAFTFFGLPVLKWQGLLPIFFLVLSMSLFPHGILDGSSINLDRIRETALKILGMK
ncbi:hypothetical protein GF319_05600|nr:hypothetical protein [Candidatus Bathyarchaeota archaeon]